MAPSRRARFSGPGALGGPTTDATPLVAPSPLNHGRIPTQASRHHAILPGYDLVEMAISQNEETVETYVDRSTMTLVSSSHDGASLGELVDSLKSFAKDLPRSDRAKTASQLGVAPYPSAIAETRAALLRSSAFVDLGSDSPSTQ